ncbi:hypothetical protein ACTHGU_01250 [Chitinophagaceae bacterium MMS25-I14]
MKLRALIIALLVFFTTFAASAQDELPVFKKIYLAADSMLRSGITGSIDTGTITAAATLDKQPPIACFNKATDLIQEGKFNDAAFIYYLGIMRYQYYSSSKPDYQSSGEEPTYSAVQSELGAPLGMYLRASADNYIKILTAVTDYYLKNDYTFYPKTKDPVKYIFQYEKMGDLIADMKKNKTVYEQKWQAERKELQQMFSDAEKIK